MGVTVDVPPGVLAKARREWDDAAEGLGNQWRRLHKVSSADLSPAVSAAFEKYRETWVDNLKARHDSATRFHDALSEVDADFAVTDVQEAERLRGLMPWVYHDAAIENDH